MSIIDTADSGITFKELPINPDRFCEGISKIGYLPSAALMDIVDNSIAAGATHIEIELIIAEGATINTSGNVMMFRITDDGAGMTDGGIDLALEMGSDVSYPNESLSKFGLGLKAAGFSLGRRIQVYSKHDGKLTALKYVDRDVIAERRKYGVCNASLPKTLAERLSESPSGTVVEILKPPAQQDSANKIKRELERRLGVTYFHFMSREKRPILVTIKLRGKVEKVLPIDIMFWNEADLTFDADKYDGKRPCRVYDDWVDNTLDPSGARLRLQIVIFPMDQMKTYPRFSEMEQKQITRYMIARDNCGFFFFRNGRLIRWGERIAGIGRDDITFRAKVSFITAHDDWFHVDVSKQHLTIPEELEAQLKLLIRTPLSQANEAHDLCANLLSKGTGSEGAKFNELTDTFEETDFAEVHDPVPPEERKKRIKELEEMTKSQGETLAANSPPSLPEEAAFARIRYSESFVGNISVALSGFDHDNGTFVRINKSHSFYQLVLARLQAADPLRVAIEALIFAGAVAEVKTTQNLAEVPLRQLEKVFNRFRSVLAQNLDSWVSANQDLFD